MAATANLWLRLSVSACFSIGFTNALREKIYPICLTSEVFYEIS